jgi:hypothetical protein
LLALFEAGSCSYICLCFFGFSGSFFGGFGVQHQCPAVRVNERCYVIYLSSVGGHFVDLIDCLRPGMEFCAYWNVASLSVQMFLAEIALPIPLPIVVYSFGFLCIYS